MSKLWNCTAGEQLGKSVAYRAAWVPRAFTLFDKTSALADVYNALAGVGFVRRASTAELVPGSDVLVVDLLPTTAGQTATVAQLAARLDDLSFRVRLFSLERIEEREVAGAEGVAARAAYRTAVATLEEKESLLPKFPAAFSELKYLLYALVAIAALFLLWKLVAVVRAK